MHRLNKPSFYEDDDEEFSGFGQGSNRFLKTNKTEPKPKDDFQRELEIKVEQRNKSNSQPFDSNIKLNEVGRSSNSGFMRESSSGQKLKEIRTPTPRSIATDSDLGEDSGAECSLGMSGSNIKGFGDSGWNPGIKKSPKALLSDERKHNTDDLFNKKPIFDRDSLYGGKSPRDSKKTDLSFNSDKWNKPSENLETKRMSSIYDDEDLNSNFGKPSTNFMKSSKDQTFKTKENNFGMDPKPRASKFKLDQDDDEEDSYHDKFPSSRFMKTGTVPNQKEKEKTNFSIHSLSKDKQITFDPNEDKDNSFQEKSSSVRFMKTSKAPLEKEDFSMKSKHRTSGLQSNLNENDKDSFHDKSSKFTKSKFRDIKEKEEQDFSFKSSSKNDKLNSDSDENQDDSFAENSSSSLLMKTIKIPNNNERDDHFIKPKSRNNKFSAIENDEDFSKSQFPSSRLIKTTKESNLKMNEKQDISKQPKLGNAKFSLEEDNNNDHFKDKSWNSDSLKSKGFNLSDNKDNQGLFIQSHKKDSKSILEHNEKEDKIPRFLRDDVGDSSKSDIKSMLRNVNEEKNTMRNSRLNVHENNIDFKRRSIRFEDEDNDKSERSSRHNSPHKNSKIKPGDKQSRSPSPVTSVCEEYERDPVQQRLEEIKQRRKERKKQEDLNRMNTEHRIASEAIDAVENYQGLPDIPPTPKKKITVPLNKKYQNIQSKISTKPNMKSASMNNLNDIWSKIDEPNSDRSFSASQALREAAYLDWYKNKLKEVKEKKKNAPVGEEETLKEKKNEEDIKATYAAWLSKKKEYFLEMKRKKEEQQKKLAENKENKDNKNSTFDLWKKMKDEIKKKEIEKQKDETKKTERKKVKEAEEKRDELRKKKSEWEIRQAKESKMKKEKEEVEKRTEQEKKKKTDEKAEQAEVSYRTWEGKMDENQRVLAAFDKKKELLVQNRKAWRPSSNTVSNGR